MTAEEYEARCGHKPIQDDLERANCPDAGKVGHYFCGWCDECNKPRFFCQHPLMLAKP